VYTVSLLDELVEGGTGERYSFKLENQAEYEKWLDTAKEMEFDNFTKGIGNGDLNRLEIEVVFPDGRMEKLVDVDCFSEVTVDG
jgi:hypothetical protein